jgi:tetratricopeptide (TPR) repeat protein
MAGNYYHGLSEVERWSYDERVALRTWLIAVVLCGAAAAQSQEEAKRHFEAGRALYDVRKYDEAIEEFETAKRLMAAPAFDYNIARCLERLQKWHDAAEAYERYRKSAPEGEQAELMAHIEELREHERELTRPPPTAKEKPLYRKGWFWATVGGAAAVVVLGVTLGVVLGDQPDPSHAIMGVTFR